MALQKTKKKHWTQKLKEENEKLRIDLYKVLDGDFQTITIYKTVRQMKQETERMIWNGSPTLTMTTKQLKQHKRTWQKRKNR